MIKHRLTSNDLKNQTISIPLSLDTFFIPIDNTESSETDFLNEQTNLSINTIDDYEKVRFAPFSGITQIEYHLLDVSGNPLTYSYFGLSNDDLKFQRNRFKNSFLRLNYFDSPNPTKQRLLFTQQLFNQINGYNRDINGELLDVNINPIIYRIVDPIKVRLGVSEGFYIYWFKNLLNNQTYPLNFYMYASYANAVDGKNTSLACVVGSYSIAQYNNINYVEYTLSKFDGINIYHPDFLNRDISMYGYKLIVNLHLLNII